MTNFYFILINFINGLRLIAVWNFALNSNTLSVLGRSVSKFIGWRFILCLSRVIGLFRYVRLKLRVRMVLWIYLCFIWLPISWINVSLRTLFLINRSRYSTSISMIFSLRTHSLILIFPHFFIINTSLLGVLCSLRNLLPHYPRKVLIISPHRVWLLLILASLHLTLCHSQRRFPWMSKVRSCSIFYRERLFLALARSWTLFPRLSGLCLWVRYLKLCLMFNLN